MKNKAGKQYDKSVNLWIASRSANSIASLDPKMIKQNRPHIFIEKPAMNEKVGDLTGKKVLTLGCGSAEEVEMLTKHGATGIWGVDVSEKLIKYAREKYPNHHFEVMDIEHLKFEENTFDFVFSSLVLHYLKDWTKALNGIHYVLKPGGAFLFSVIHPVKWSAKKLNDTDGKSYAALMGFSKDPKTGVNEIYGDYHNIVKLKETWMKSLTVTLYPRSIQAMFRPLVEAGFRVVDIYEPKAIPEAKKYDKTYYDINQRIPNFIIFACKKD